MVKAPSARTAAVITTVAMAAGAGALAPAASAATPSSTAVVRKVAPGARYVNLRAGTSTSSAVRGRLPAGVSITGTLSRGWVHITAPLSMKGFYVSDSVLAYGGPDAVHKPTCGSQDSVGAGYVLCLGYVGVKAYTTRQKLGLPVTRGQGGSTLGADAIAALKKFQGDHGLPVTGEVDRATFTALGGGDFDMDAWINPAWGGADSVGAMVSWAAGQKGKPYIWGGLGEFGYDCSGLVLQALRAGGLKPVGVNNLTDVRPQSDLSRQMWNDRAEFRHVTELTNTNLPKMLATAKPGDVVFYADRSKVVGHVGIYAGNKIVIDAVDGSVKVESAPANWGYSYFALARPFN